MSHTPTTTHVMIISAPSLASSKLPGAPTTGRHRRPVSASFASAAPPSLYDVLGVGPGATRLEIKSAYRKLARSCHPDTAAGAGRPEGGAADEFMRVHAAYATLTDPERRADYDRQLAAFGRQLRVSSVTTPSPGFSGYGRRSWETDQCW